MSVLRLGIPKAASRSDHRALRKSGWAYQIRRRSYFPSVDDPACAAVSSAPRRWRATSSPGRSTPHHRPRLDPRERRRRRGDPRTSELEGDAAGRRAGSSSSPSARRAEGSRISAQEDRDRAPNYTRATSPSARSTSSRVSPGVRPRRRAPKGLVDAIVEVTETGSTLRANGLRIVCELFQSNPQLIANHAALKDPWSARRSSESACCSSARCRRRCKSG